MLLADFAPGGLPNPAAKPLDLAIQREQGSTSASRWTNNTLRGDYLVSNWVNIRPCHYRILFKEKPRPPDFV
jgi:hypothetical protein